jgi:hypothetical protein
VIERTGSWESGQVVLVLGAWRIGGQALCLLTPAGGNAGGLTAP